MAVAVLGPLRVEGNANGLGPRDRVVLSALVVRAGAPVTQDALADALWGDHVPATWTKVVQGCIVRLRKILGQGAIESGPAGYRLTLSDDELDHRLFERLLERGRESLAAEDPARASYLAQEALELWRGPALADLEEWEPGRVEAGRLEGLRMEAEEVWVEAEIAAGHSQAVLERARVLVSETPFREQRWALLATALYQAGRQPEALGAVKRARAMLVDELGLDPGPDLVRLEQLLLQQDPSLRPPVSHTASVVCPYPGLLPYGTEDADSFFGRQDDVAACLRRLRDSRVLAVVGASGVGKSSLVRAGVVASLTRAGAPVLVMTPGVHPMDSLSGLKPRGRQTLVVDQAEESVTLCTDPAERARFFATLAEHVGAGGALVVSLRADHLGDLAPYPSIVGILEDGLYLLGPMNEPELRHAIEGPARRAGLRLEPGLVDLLVREVEGEPAALPLLSHVLRAIWEHREGPTLTVAGYRATGGIRQAVAQSAESLYDALDAARRTQLRGLMLRLVSSAEIGDPVRTRLPRDQVAADVAHSGLVEQLVEARLVAVDDQTLQIAHEALVRVWPRLRGWLDDDVEGQRLLRHLAGAADAWNGMGRPDSELYRGMRLSRALEWRDRAVPELNDAETMFLDASVALAAADKRVAELRAVRERRSRRRLGGALAGVAVFLALALIAGVLAVRAGDRAEENRRRSEAEARLAEARRAESQAAGQQNPSVGILLSLEALAVDDSAQARDTLGAMITRAGSLEGTRDLDGLPVSMSSSREGSLLAVSLAPDAPEPGVHLFDSVTLEPVDFAETAPSSIIRFSPDGRHLALAVNEWVSEGAPRLDEQPIQLYDVPAGTLSRQQLGGMSYGSGIEYAMEYSDDGQRLAAAVQRWDLDARHWTGLGTATVWDLAHPSRPVFGVTVPDYAAIALSPDGERVFTAMPGRRSVRAYDVDTGTLLAAAHDLRLTDQPGGLDVSPDGSTVAVTSDERVLRLDATTLRRRGPDLHGTDLAEGGRFSHDGKLLAAASSDGSVVVWDVATGTLAHRFAAPGGVWASSIDWSADDQTLIAAGENLMTWRLGDVPGLLTLGEDTPAVEGTAYDLSLAAPDGHSLARIKSNRLWFADLTTGRETPPSAPMPPVWDARWSPDGRWLLTTSGEGLLVIWETATGRRVAARQLARGPIMATFSPDGDEVYAEDLTGTVSIFERATLRQNGARFYEGTASEIAMAARADSLLIVRSDGSFVRVQPDTGRILGEAPPSTLSHPQGAPSDLSPDGTLLATPDESNRMVLLDVESLEWIGPDPDADPLPTTEARVVFAPDGSQLAALLTDRIALWDGRTAEYLGSVPLPALATDGSIRYLPDSTGLLVAARDGRTWVADTRTDEWPARACTLAGRNLTAAEWKRFFPTRPYSATCTQWPAGS